MKTERCSQCGNMVVGSFNPSTARTYLTKIAKKGGMKALLATVGSVIPGFGTIAGFLTGTVIDVMYGKNIDKFIDKAIDAFQDKKVYVFTCPNCGKSWTNKYDTIEDAILTFDIDDRVEEIEESIEAAKNYYLLSESFVTRALEAFELIEKASKDFQDFIEGSLDTDKIEECEEAQEQITELMLEFILWISKNCKGSMESPIIAGISKNDLNKSLSMRVYGAYPIFQGEGYLLVAVIHAGILRDDDKISFAGMEIPVETISMFGRECEQAEAGDVCAIVVSSTATDKQDREKRIEFPNTIFTVGEKNEDPREFIETIQIEYGETIPYPQLTSDEEEYLIEYRACLEEDGVITDRERRLLDRIRKSLGISEERARELEASCTAPSFTEEEQEYADEIRTCLEEGGHISERERRLLNKLRISLGISESRANEIEALVK